MYDVNRPMFDLKISFENVLILYANAKRLLFAYKERNDNRAICNSLK